MINTSPEVPTISRLLSKGERGGVYQAELRRIDGAEVVFNHSQNQEDEIIDHKVNKILFFF